MSSWTAASRAQRSIRPRSGWESKKAMLSAMLPAKSGTSGADRIAGIQIDEVIRALGGNDTAWGGRGNDQVHGEAGQDQLFGQAGDDVLRNVIALSRLLMERHGGEVPSSRRPLKWCGESAG